MFFFDDISALIRPFNKLSLGRIAICRHEATMAVMHDRQQLAKNNKLSLSPVENPPLLEHSSGKSSISNHLGDIPFNVVQGLPHKLDCLLTK